MTQVKYHSGVLSPCFYTIAKCPEHLERFGTQVISANGSGEIAMTQVKNHCPLVSTPLPNVLSIGKSFVLRLTRIKVRFLAEV